MEYKLLHFLLDYKEFLKYNIVHYNKFSHYNKFISHIYKPKIVF